jgi:RNA polymerase sigma-70 factor (ECF subfamily)
MTTGAARDRCDDESYRWVLEHAAAVRGYLLGLVRQPDVADDLAQETFRRAWQARQRYRDIGHTRAWLLTIADRLACDRARQAGREQTLDDDAWRALEPTGREGGPEEELLRQESAAALADALDQLSDLQRRVLLLRYYGNLDFAEIARIIGCPLNTALSHCRRGLLSLRKLLSHAP